MDVSDAFCTADFRVYVKLKTMVLHTNKSWNILANTFENFDIYSQGAKILPANSEICPVSQV
jgi:hypothetical protein